MKSPPAFCNLLRRFERSGAIERLEQLEPERRRGSVVIIKSYTLNCFKALNGWNVLNEWNAPEVRTVASRLFYKAVQRLERAAVLIHELPI